MKYIRILLILLLILFFNNQVYSLNFNSPGALKQNDISISLASFIEHDGNFGVLLINDFGVIDWLNPIIKIGFTPVYDVVGKETVYLGLETKIMIWERFGGTDKFSVYMGGHYKLRNEVSGLDLGISIGSTFFKFDNYIGIDVDLDFVNNEIQYPIDFIIGAKFTPFNNKKFSFDIEVGIPIAYSYNYKLGTALRLSF